MRNIIREKYYLGESIISLLVTVPSIKAEDYLILLDPKVFLCESIVLSLVNGHDKRVTTDGGR